MVYIKLPIALLCVSIAQAISAESSNNNCCPKKQPSQMNQIVADKEIGHLSFNRIAAELNLPFFWQPSQKDDKKLTPDTVYFLWGVSDDKAYQWIDNGQFTPTFYQAYNKVIDVYKHGYDEVELDKDEKQRRKLVRQELAEGLPTLIARDFTQFTSSEQKMIRHILNAAQIIEVIFAKQNGAYTYKKPIALQDTASKMLFFRNQGPWCKAPGVSSNPNCNAISEKPLKTSGLYPKSIQTDKHFCEKLAQLNNSEGLLNPFTTVSEENGRLFAIPYHISYRKEIREISKELALAADALPQSTEQAMQTYLKAASKAFLNNDWLPADEAWSKMNATNSKWYLRIAPDEVYFDPCNLKAGFHVAFATINEDSKIWQEKLEPLKSEMENTLADLAGLPYVARDVSFHLPDFIDIVLNAGNSRHALGATIGQSLPNWGPVAQEGRGRTVAMTNLYTDPDSMHNKLTQVQSLVCPRSMADYTEDKGPKTMSVVLHEAAHNLGPAHEYKVDGKTDKELFGGPLASMLEELKAQSAALFFTDWLLQQGVIDKEYAQKAHHADITWMFGHIAQGMYGSHGQSNAYSQLSAIQLGFLMDHNALTWKPGTMAANGKDKGCFEFNQEKLPEVIHKLIKKVAGIKARGDKAQATSLKKTYVDQTGKNVIPMDIIAKRWLRQPKSSFVYSIKLDDPVATDRVNDVTTN